MFDKSDSVLSCRQKTIVSLEVKDFSAVPSSAAKKKKSGVSRGSATNK